MSLVAVFVLYKQNRILKAIIITAFVAEVICMMVLVSFVIRGQTFTPDCLAATSPRIFVGYWWVPSILVVTMQARLNSFRLQANVTAVRDILVCFDPSEVLSG